jgi:hypothetical protein
VREFGEKRLKNCRKKAEKKQKNEQKFHKKGQKSLEKNGKGAKKSEKGVKKKCSESPGMRIKKCSLFFFIHFSITFIHFGITLYRYRIFVSYRYDIKNSVSLVCACVLKTDLLKRPPLGTPFSPSVIFA